MRRLLREPLLHFVLIGVGLFVLWSFVEPAPDAASAPHEVALSQGDLEQLALQFEAQWRRPPSARELVPLVEDRVKEEILYREALELGLDQGDTIVKRRMAQKMQFLAEGAAAAREPEPAELAAWFDANRERFAEPPRISFRHLYFSPDRRGAGARDDAARALERLADRPVDAKLDADRFPFQEYYRERAPEFLGKEFGPGFAQAVTKLAPGSWQGPIESGFGWHLVFVDGVVPGRVPGLEEVGPDVRSAWLAEQKARAWEETWAQIRAKYTVLLPVGAK